MDCSNGRRSLTIDEKIERYRNFQALSPRSSANKIRELSGLHAVHWFRVADDLDCMADLTSEEDWEEAGVEIEHFGGFCRCFDLIKEVSDADPASRPLGGCRYGNAMVLILLCYISAIKSKRDNPIKTCLHMTFKDYLGALYDLCRQDEALERRLRGVLEDGVLLQDTLDMPMYAALEEWFTRYIHAIGRFEFVRYMVRMAGECTYIRNKRKDPSNPSLDYFKRRLEEFSFARQSEDTIIHDRRITDMFYLDVLYSNMLTPGFLHGFWLRRGIDRDFIEYIDSYLEEADLAGAMKEINTVIAAVELLLILMPKVIYERDYRFDGHYEM